MSVVRFLWKMWTYPNSFVLFTFLFLLIGRLWNTPDVLDLIRERTGNVFFQTTRDASPRTPTHVHVCVNVLIRIPSEESREEIYYLKQGNWWHKLFTSLVRSGSYVRGIVDTNQVLRSYTLLVSGSREGYLNYTFITLFQGREKWLQRFDCTPFGPVQQLVVSSLDVFLSNPGCVSSFSRTSYLPFFRVWYHRLWTTNSGLGKKRDTIDSVLKGKQQIWINPTLR